MVEKGGDGTDCNTHMRPEPWLCAHLTPRCAIQYVHHSVSIRLRPRERLLSSKSISRAPGRERPSRQFAVLVGGVSGPTAERARSRALRDRELLLKRG